MAFTDKFKNDMLKYVKERYNPKDIIVEPSIEYFQDDTRGSLYKNSFHNSKEYYELLEKMNISTKMTGTWQSCVFQIIDAKGYYEPDVYKRALISKQTFSKIRSDINYQPKRTTAIQMCFGLKLSIDESVDLMAKAGFAFSYANPSDIVCRYFIENKNYDIDDLNMGLAEIDCQPLGVLA